MTTPSRTRNLTFATISALALTVGIVTLVRSQDGDSPKPSIMTSWRWYLPNASNRPEVVSQPSPGPTLPRQTAVASRPAPTLEPTPESPSAVCECPWPPAPYAIESVLMKLERSPCFGACPEYSVEVHGDGRVIYEGRRFVRVEGRQEAQIDRAAVEDLLNAFYDAHFFAMEAEYREHRYPCVDANGLVEECLEFVTDLPSRDVTFQSPGYMKHVLDYWHGPAELHDLEAKIDEVAGTDRWVPMATPTP